MKIDFYKYQGTGNDFVMVDNRAKTFPKNNTDKIAAICHRNFGVGADGLILLENDTQTDFKMVYYNADGSQGMMCGNGGRCIVAFAHFLGLFTSETTFNAVDGLHYAKFNNGIVSLQMIDVNNITVNKDFVHAYTGSPHHITLVKDIDNYQVFTEGQKLRNSYGEEGCNVNFVEQVGQKTFRVRTYERGVENETLACGTGVTAVAIAMHKTKKTKSNTLQLLVQGGKLEVSFTEEDEKYSSVFLTGKATFVFKGSITI